MPRPMPDGPGKRYPLSSRLTEETHNALREAAKLSGRSVSQEAEFRLEQSFARDAVQSGELKRDMAADALLGDADTADLIRTVAASARLAMSYTGGHWRDDIYARAGVIAAMNAARSAYFLSHPYKDDAREADQAKLYKADSIGKLLGRMLAASELDPDIGILIRDMAERAPPLPEGMPLMEAQALEEALQIEAPRKSKSQ